MLTAVYRLLDRQTTCFAQSMLDLLSADLLIPDYTTLCKRNAELRVRVPTSNLEEPKHILMGSTVPKV